MICDEWFVFVKTGKISDYLKYSASIGKEGAKSDENKGDSP